MTPVQRFIKYCAIALAVCLILGIAAGTLGLLSALTGVGPLLRGDSEPVEVYEEFPGGADRLDMEIGAADIRIATGSTLSVQTDNPYITFQESSGTLVIQEKPHIANLEGSTLTLTVPEELVFDRAEITTGAGKIEAEALACSRLELELGAGLAEFHSLTVLEQVDLEGGAGKIVIHDGSLRNLDFDMGLGEADIVTALKGNCEVSAGIGALYLTVLGEPEDFTLRAEQGIGRVEVDGTFVSGERSLGTGPNVLEIEGGIGSVTVDFEN